MSEIKTITKDEFIQAVDEMAGNHQMNNLVKLHRESPEHIRPIVEDGIFRIARELNQTLESDPENHGKLVTAALKDDFDGVDEFLFKNPQAPNEMWVELAVLSACNSPTHVSWTLEEKDLKKKDRKRILDAAMTGIEKDVVRGWADVISTLFRQKDLTTKQHKTLCQAVERAFKVSVPEELSWHDIAREVLINTDAPVEIRRLALEKCALAGYPEPLIEILQTDDSQLIFGERRDAWMAISVVSVQVAQYHHKIQTLLDLSTEWDSLPEIVQEIIPKVLENILNGTEFGTLEDKADAVRDSFEIETTPGPVVEVLERKFLNGPERDWDGRGLLADELERILHEAERHGRPRPIKKAQAYAHQEKDASPSKLGNKMRFIAPAGGKGMPKIRH